MPEEEIIAGICIGGSRRHAALRAWITGPVGTRMRRFFISNGIAEQDSVDVLQDTIINVVTKAHTFRADGAGRSWLWQIARNCMADFYRRNAAHQVLLDEDQWRAIEETTASDSGVGEVDSVDECFDRGMNAFSAQMPERALVLNMQMDGATVAEIAVKLGRTVAAAKQYLYECRKHLQPFVVHCTALLSP